MPHTDAEERIAWAAGFLEGDGSFSSAGRYPMVSVAGTEPQPLVAFARAVGAGHLVGPYDRRDPRRFTKRPMYWVQIYSDAIPVIQKLWPYLGPVKRAAIETTLRRIGRAAKIGESLDIRWHPRQRVALAWAAGFFDAEGCFSSTPRVGVCASITQTDREVLERFRRAVGIGKIYGPYRTPHTDDYVRKPHYFFRAHGNERVQAILAMLWPWLGTTKRQQAIDRLVWMTTCRNGHPKKPGHTGCGECTKAYWAARREARQQNEVREAAVLYLPEAA